MLTVVAGLFSWLLQWIENEHDLMNMMEAVSPIGLGVFLILILLVSWGLHTEKSTIQMVRSQSSARMVIGGMTFVGIVGMTLFFVVAQTMIINPSHAEEVIQHGRDVFAGPAHRVAEIFSYGT